MERNVRIITHSIKNLFGFDGKLKEEYRDGAIYVHYIPETHAITAISIEDITYPVAYKCNRMPY